MYVIFSCTIYSKQAHNRNLYRKNDVLKGDNKMNGVDHKVIVVLSFTTFKAKQGICLS